jgi:poly(3-hydroxybutyrate) depolymerase
MKRGGRPNVTASHPLVPTIVFHGDDDTTVNPINGDQVIAQAKAGANLRLTVSRGEAPGGIGYDRSIQSDESGRPVLEQWVLHGAGHAWSGGSPAGSYTEPRGPDAAREMLSSANSRRRSSLSRADLLDTNRAPAPTRLPVLRPMPHWKLERIGDRRQGR